jgi:hypothetical protein
MIKLVYEKINKKRLKYFKEKMSKPRRVMVLGKK